MLNRRTLLGAFSALAMMAAVHGPAVAQDNYDIALISKGFQHQFWQAVKAGADKAAAEFGVTVTFEGPETETQVDRQMDMLAAALSRKPDAIGFAALDSQAASPLLQQAKDANIPIIAFDSGVDSDIPLTTVPTDNVAAAALAADKMADAAFPGIDRFQKVGEGAFETLVRVASTVEAVTVSLDQLGMSARALGIDAKMGWPTGSTACRR